MPRTRVLEIIKSVLKGFLNSCTGDWLAWTSWSEWDECKRASCGKSEPRWGYKSQTRTRKKFSRKNARNTARSESKGIDLKEITQGLMKINEHKDIQTQTNFELCSNAKCSGNYVM